MGTKIVLCDIRALDFFFAHHHYSLASSDHHHSPSQRYSKLKFGERTLRRGTVFAASESHHQVGTRWGSANLQFSWRVWFVCYHFVGICDFTTTPCLKASLRLTFYYAILGVVYSIISDEGRKRKMNSHASSFSPALSALFIENNHTPPFSPCAELPTSHCVCLDLLQVSLLLVHESEKENKEKEGKEICLSFSFSFFYS